MDWRSGLRPAQNPKSERKSAHVDPRGTEEKKAHDGRAAPLPPRFSRFGPIALLALGSQFVEATLATSPKPANFWLPRLRRFVAPLPFAFLCLCLISALATPPDAQAQTNEWTWVGGSSSVGSNGGQPGVYGTLGAPASGNVPGGRFGPVSWTDGSGNLWLFGGQGYDADGNYGNLNGPSGSSTLPRKNGRGWEEAAPPANPASTAYWERLRKRPWSPLYFRELDRQQRESLALWGWRFRRRKWRRGLAQRPVGVQSFRERMDVEGRKRHDQPVRRVRHPGNACGIKRPWEAAITPP